MSTPQETRVITSRVIAAMSERYNDVWSGFMKSGDHAYDTDLGDGTLGMILGRILGPAYETAQRGCTEALRGGAIASRGISDSLSTCAANWRTAEQASIVEYR
ncbi:hypothetical protein ACIBI9_09595 [Nonomuraea sp. NPDC050451]|uniref:hypothetical protein n=1 Tax=Nonomuraea sp. NPDC050451 TaxID=3364364 RepID=UPI0037A274C7